MKLPLFHNDTIATTHEVYGLLREHKPVAIGVSGGKDSSAVAIRTCAHLDAVGHIGQRILIHSDLGVTEWKQSKQVCEDLARKLSLPLVVVHRAKGDMMDRWEQRWHDNVKRYADLNCVKLILPWSTPSMRFCTSEMKTAPICRRLRELFPYQTIISVTGIRRQESSGRAKAPVTKPQPKLTSKGKATRGIDWHPIIDWSTDDVLSYLRVVDFPLHEAYTRYGSSRVSCAFCIMSSQSDLRSAAGCSDNFDLYRRMVDLEADSTFAFQGSGWLADVRPELLTTLTLRRLDAAKCGASRRIAAEALLPKDLLYVKGWPTRIPSPAEAGLLAMVRIEVSAAAGIEIKYTRADEIRERYRELIALKHERAAVPA